MIVCRSVMRKHVRTYNFVRARELTSRSSTGVKKHSCFSSLLHTTAASLIHNSLTFLESRLFRSEPQKRAHLYKDECISRTDLYQLRKQKEVITGYYNLEVFLCLFISSLTDTQTPRTLSACTSCRCIG